MIFQTGFKKIYSFKEKSNKQSQNWQLLRKIISNLRQKTQKKTIFRTHSKPEFEKSEQN